jgi:6-phosphofructokinase 1
MNAAIRAIVRCGIDAGVEVYGIERGYDGLIGGEIFEMNRQSVSDIIQRGGTILRTARSKAFQTEEGFNMALNMLSSFHIDALVVIGGNGSLRGALDLVRAGVKIIGLPGTIDNDLAYTDFTIGFDTSVNTVLSAVSNVRDTSHSHDRTTIIEVMGAKSGDIAVHAGLSGGTEIILVPEHPIDVSEICRMLIENRNRGKMSSIIIKAEGVDIPTDELDREITDRTGLDVKTVILGYIQRGGSPSASDRVLASRLGSKAIQLVLEEDYNKVVGIKNNQIIAQDIEGALAEQSVPADELHQLADLLSR